MCFYQFENQQALAEDIEHHIQTISNYLKAGRDALKAFERFS